MKVIIINEYENVNVQEYTEVNKSELRESDVLIKNKALSVNPIDCKAKHTRGKTVLKT